MKVFKDRNKELEKEIDLYLGLLKEAALVFHEGVSAYVSDDMATFEAMVVRAIEYEKEADERLKQVKYTLYRYNLMPDLATDILELMDALDEISDVSKRVLLALKVEMPEIPSVWNGDFTNITQTTVKSVDRLIDAVTAFFKNIRLLDACVIDIGLYESEVDRLEHLLKCKIFDKTMALSMDLSQKMHLRYFAQKIASLSDVCEAIGNRLAVIKFKQTI